MWLYQFLDIAFTAAEMLCLYLFSLCLCKEPRFRSGRLLPPCALFVVIWVMTWFTGLGAYKILVLVVLGTILLKICYRDSVWQVIAAHEIYFTAASIFPESLGCFVAEWIYGDALLVQVEGVTIIRWEAYCIVFLIRMLAVWGIYRICRNFQYRVQCRDCLVLTACFMPGFITFVLDCFNYLNLEKTSETVVYISNTLISMTFLVVFLYSKNTLYLQKQAQQDKLQILQLQQQFAYYQDKLKDEERVRSVYHDMKNHLLVLKQQTGSDEAAEMIEKLQREVAMYEDYVHTGNKILDIILKEKAGLAREKNIDLCVCADLGGIDFIEPLDISTIFGNGLDNAIEASEKLAEGQRAILVKAGKVQAFFAVLMENNCREEESGGKRATTKADDFLHGFGISNMRKAAEKYGGQMTTRCEDGRFALKILIPVPETVCTHGLKQL